jgi:hypothetical protein
MRRFHIQVRVATKAPAKVVDSVAPVVRPTGGVANNPRVLVRMLKIDNAVGGLLYVLQEIHDIWI